MEIKNIELVKIFQPAKSAMQSGKAKRKWLIQPIAKEKFRKIDNIMGWVSSDSTALSQLDFEFNSKEEAVEFAKKNGLNFEIHEPKKAALKKKSYAANFC